MRNHPKLSACLVNRLYAYGTGGPVSLRYDRDILAYFEERFASDGHRVPALLRNLATSQAFAAVRQPQETVVADVAVVTGTLRSGDSAARGAAVDQEEVSR